MWRARDKQHHCSAENHIKHINTLFVCVHSEETGVKIDGVGSKG